jgi:hypothetical protein
VASVQDIREGISARLDTIAGLRAHALMPAVINSPAAVVSRRSTAFDSTMGGESDDLTFAVTVFIEWTDERTAQLKLDSYLGASGATSIKASVEADPTLGGVVDYTRVATVERDRIVEWAGSKYLAADLVIEVG